MSWAKWGSLAVLLAVLAGTASDLSAQQVHLLLAGDTADRHIGNTVRRDLGAVAGTFLILLREGQLDLSRLEGQQVSADALLKAIDHFQVKPDDALVCYWSGHGAFDNDGHYLQMPQGGNLYRLTLLGAMKKKQARLTVLLSDCCNQYRDTTVGKRAMAPSADPRRQTSPLFEELFIKPRGLVDVNAAAQEEVALSTNDGGLLTLAMTCMSPGRSAAAEEGYRPDRALGVFWRNARKQVSWQTLIEESRRQVQELFEQVSPDGLRGSDGKVYHKQTVVAWSLPEAPGAKPAQDRGSRFGVEAVDNNGEGVRVVRVWAEYPGTQVTDVVGGKVLSLQRGDVILSINGRKIGNTKDYWDAVKSSPQTMELTVRDVRDGQNRTLQAQLRN